MDSEEFSVTVTDEECGFEQEKLTFRYTEKDAGDQKVQRYQLTDELGIVFSGEKIWRTEEKDRLFGLLKTTEGVYEQEVQKRIGYDKKLQSVVTEEASWDEFEEFLQGTDAQKYFF